MSESPESPPFSQVAFKGFAIRIHFLVNEDSVERYPQGEGRVRAARLRHFITRLQGSEGGCSDLRRLSDVRPARTRLPFLFSSPIIASVSALLRLSALLLPIL